MEEASSESPTTTTSTTTTQPQSEARSIFDRLMNSSVIKASASFSLPSSLKESLHTSLQNSLPASLQNSLPVSLQQQLAPSSSSSEKEESSSSYHSEKIDQILNDIPERFKEENTKGFLSVLHSNTELSKEEIDALRVPLDDYDDGWDLFHRVLFGKENDVRPETVVEKKVEEQVCIDFCNIDPSSNDFRSFEEMILEEDNDNQEHDPLDPFGLEQIQKEISQIILEEKEPDVRYPEGAWWIDEMKSIGWLNDDDGDHESKILNFRLDDDTMKEPKNPPAEERKNDLSTLLTDVKFVTDNDDTGQQNDGKDNGSSNVEDDHNKPTTKDWSENLWAAARTHYHKVFPKEEKNVAPFRSLLEMCIHAYMQIFHNKFENSGFDEEFIELLQIPGNLPLSLFSELIEIFLKKIVERLQSSTEETDSQILLGLTKNCNVATLKYTVIAALLDVNSQIFHRYEVELVDIHSRFHQSSEGESSTIKSGYADQQTSTPKRFMKKLVTSNYTDNSAVERFIYGPEFFLLQSCDDDDSSHKQDPTVKVETTSQVTTEQNCKEEIYDDIEEVQLNPTITSCFKSSDLKPEFGLDCLEYFFFLLLGRVGVDQEKLDLLSRHHALDEIKDFIPFFAGEPSLSVIFALQFLARFSLLKQAMDAIQKHLEYRNDEVLEELCEEEECKFNLNFVHGLLVDCNLLHRRISAVGALFTVNQCLNDWQILRTLSRIESGNIEELHYDSLYSDDTDCQLSLSLFRNLISTLVTVFNEVSYKGKMWTQKERECLGKKVLQFETLFDEVKVDKIPKHQRIHISFCCIDVGRCCYNLGIEYGKSVKLNEGFNSKEFNEVELRAYELAIKSFRQASNLLAMDKASSPKVHDLSVSNDLYLADALVAAAFCHDTKAHNYKKSIRCYKEALSRYKHFGNFHMSIGNTLQNLGSVYYSAGKFDEALRCYKKRLLIIQHFRQGKSKSPSTKIPNNTLIREEAYSRKSLARVYQKQGFKNNAIENYEISLSCFRQLPFMSSFEDYHDFADCLTQLSRLYLFKCVKYETSINNHRLKQRRDIELINGQETKSLLPLLLEMDSKAFKCLEDSINVRLLNLSDQSGEGKGIDQGHIRKDLIQDMLQLAILHFRKEDYDEALSFFVQAWNLSFKSEQLQQSFNPTSMKNIQIQELAIEHNINIKLLFCMGNIWTRQKEYQNALSCYNIAIEVCNFKIAPKVEGASDDNNEINGIRLDLACIHGNKGFVLLEIGEDMKSSQRELQTSLQLLDQSIQECDSQNFNEIDFSASIKKLKLSVAKDFSAQVYVRFLIAKFLNVLGRLYEKDLKSQTKSISCFEESMLILDDILDDCKEGSILVPSNIRGSSLECNLSIHSFFNILADSFHRSGNYYTKSNLKDEGMIAYERAINILEDEASMYMRDDEYCHRYCSPPKRDSQLLSLYSSMIEVYHEINLETKFDSLDCHLTVEDLQFRIGNHHARAKMFPLALEKYLAAMTLTEAKLFTRNHNIFANLFHNIAMVQKEMISSDEGYIYKAKENFFEAIKVSLHDDVRDLSLASESMIQLANLIMETECWNPYNPLIPKKEEVERLLKEALKMRTELYGENDINVANSHAEIGMFHFNLGQTNEAKYHLNKANSIFSGKNQFVIENCNTLFALGQVLIKTADENGLKLECFEILEKAIVCFQDCLNIISNMFSDQQILRNSRAIELKVNCLLELVYIFQRKGNQKNSLQSITKLLATIQCLHKSNVASSGSDNSLQHHFRYQIGASLLQLGMILEKRYNSPFAFFLKSYRILVEQSSLNGKSYHDSLSILKLKLSKIHFQQGHVGKSMTLLLHSAEPSTSGNGNHYPEKIVMNCYLGAHLASSQFEKALKHYHDALGSLEEIQIPQFTFNGMKSLIHHQCAKLYYKLEKIENTISHVRQAEVFLERYQAQRSELYEIPISGDRSYDCLNMLLYEENWDTLQLENFAVMLIVMTYKPQKYTSFQKEVANMVHKTGVICQSFGKSDEAFHCQTSTLQFNHRMAVNRSSILLQVLQYIGDLYKSFHQHEKSLICYEECYSIITASSLSGEKQSPHVIYMLGDLAHKLGRTNEAEKWLEIIKNSSNGSSSKGDDGIVNSFILETNVLYDKGNYNEALETLNTALSAVKKGGQNLGKKKISGNIFYLYGKVYSKKGNFNEAIDAYQQCFQLRKDVDYIGCAEVQKGFADVLKSLKRIGEAHAFLCDRIKATTLLYGSDNSFVAIALHELGEFLLENIQHYDRYEDLIQNLLKEAIRICYFNNDFHAIAKCFFLLGTKERYSVSKALNYYLNALQIFEDKKIHNHLLSRLLYNLGCVYYKENDYFQAVKSFRRALLSERKIHCSDDELIAKIAFSLGMAELKLSEMDSALSNISLALQMFMKANGNKFHDSILFCLLGNAKCHAIRGEEKELILSLSKAKSLWEKIKDECPRNEEVHILFGDVYSTTGNYEAAIQHYEKALKIQSCKSFNFSFVSIQVKLAEANFQNCTYDASSSHASRGIELCVKHRNHDLQTHHSKFLELLGDIAFQKGSISKAEMLYDSAMQIQGVKKIQLHRLLVKIGSCHIVGRNFDESIKYFLGAMEASSTLLQEESYIFFQAKQGLAFSYFMTKQKEKALQNYLELHTDIDHLDHDDIVHIHLKLGQLYLDENKRVEACSHFDRAITCYEQFKEELNLISARDRRVLLSNESVILQLLEMYQKWIMISDSSAPASLLSLKFGYANLLTKSGDLKKAVEVYESILEGKTLQVENELLYASTMQNLAHCQSVLGNITMSTYHCELSLATFTEIYGDDDPNVAEVMLQMAETYAANSKFVDAIALGQKSLNLVSKREGSDKKVGFMLGSLGNILLQSGEIEASLKALLDGLNILQKYFETSDNNLSSTYFHIGDVYYTKRQYEKAMEYYKLVSPSSRFICDTLFQMAKIYNLRDEEERAKINFNACFDVITKELGVLSGLVLYDENEEKHLSKAIKSFEVIKDSIQSNAADCKDIRQFTGIVNTYGKLLAVVKMHEEALFCFNFSLQLYHPSSKHVGDLLYERGVVYSKLGNFTMGVASLKDAVKIFRLSLLSHARNTRLCMALKLLGECQSKLGHIRDALTTLEEVEAWLLKTQRQDRFYTINGDDKQAVKLQIGKLNQSKMEYRAAHDTFSACMKLSHSLETKSIEGDSAYALGVLYFENGYFLRALLNYQHALDIYNTVNMGSDSESEDNIRVILSVGDVFATIGRPRDALRCFEYCFQAGKNHDLFDERNKNIELRRILTKIGYVNFQIGQYEKAAQIFHEIIESYHSSNPNDGNNEECIHSWIKLADTYKALSEYENALFCFHNALKMHNITTNEEDSFLGDVLEKIGVCQLMKCDYTNATKSLSAALRIKLAINNSNNKDNLGFQDLRCLLGLAYYYLGDKKNSRRNFEEVIHVTTKQLVDNTSHPVLLEKSMKAYIKLMRQLGLEDASAEADALEKCGILQAKQGKYEDAIRSHKYSLKIHQKIYGSKSVNVANSLYNIGMCMNSSDSVKDSSKLLEKALKIMKDIMGIDSIECVDVLHQLGISLHLIDKDSQAKIYLQEAIDLLKLHSQHETLQAAEINKILGEIKFDQEPREAEHYLSESLRIKSAHGKFSDLSSLLVKLSTLQKDTKKAQHMIGIYENCLLHLKVYEVGCEKIVSMIYLNLGIAFESRNNSDKALICYKKSYEVKVEGNANIKLHALIRRATLLVCCERDEEAKAVVQSAYKQSEETERTEILMLEGQLYERTGKVEKAIESYTLALLVACKQDKELMARCKAELANLLFGLQKYHQARQHVDDALKNSEGMIKAKLLLLQGQLLQTEKREEEALHCFDKATNLLIAFHKKGSLFNLYHMKSHRLLLAKAKFLKGSIQANDDTKATKLFKESLILLRKHSSKNDSMKGIILQKLGKIHVQKKNYSIALGCFYEAIKIYSNQNIAVNVKIAHIMLDMAFLFFCKGNHSKVLLCCSATIPVLEKEKGQENLNIILAKCRGLKAIAHDELDEYDNALGSYEESIQAFRCFVSNNSFSSLTKDMKETYIFLASTCARKATLYERLNQDALAIRQYSDAVNVYKSIFGSNHNLFVADIFERMGSIRGRQKKYDKAFVLMEAAIEIRMKILGFNHVKVAQGLYCLGVLFDQNKEYDAAINSLTDCLEIQGQTLGPTSRAYADTLAALAQSTGNCGDLEDAIKVLNEAIAIYELNGYKTDNEKIIDLEKQLRKAEKVFERRRVISEA